MKKSMTSLFATLLTVVSSYSMASDLEMYGKAGVPGVGIGVGYGVSEKLTVRSDFTTMGSISRDFSQNDFKYDAKLKSNKLDIAADYFPVDNSALRLTAGLSFGRTELTAHGVSKKQGNQSFTVGGKTYNVKLDSNDTLDAKMKYPAVSPYLGIGWGHDVKRKNAGQWSFTADLGMYIGTPKTTVSVNDGLREKLIQSQLDTQTRKEAAAELDSRIDKEKRKIKDKVEKLKVIPVVMLGVTYHF